MATRRYKHNPGASIVTEEVGAANNSDTVELTVDLASTEVNFNGSTRIITKAEVLESIEKIRQHIITDVWPPA